MMNRQQRRRSQRASKKLIERKGKAQLKESGVTPESLTIFRKIYGILSGEIYPRVKAKSFDDDQGNSVLMDEQGFPYYLALQPAPITDDMMYGHLPEDQRQQLSAKGLKKELLDEMQPVVKDKDYNLALMQLGTIKDEDGNWLMPVVRFVYNESYHKHRAEVEEGMDNKAIIESAEQLVKDNTPKKKKKK